MAELGLGLAALGRPAYVNLGHGDDLAGQTAVEAVEERCHAMLDAARASDIVYLDCARSYGRGEAFLGRWLRSRAIEPGALTIASKWGYRYVGEWALDAEVHEVKDHSVEHLRAQLPQTTEHLWEYLDIYQIHSATLDTGVLDDPAVIADLGRLRDERGLHIGLSTSGLDQARTIDRALPIEVDGRPLFSVVQATFNLLERSVGPALGRAQTAGCRVVVKEGVANGRLTSRGVGPHRPGIGLAEALERAEHDLGLPRDAVALGALLAQPFVDVVLSGATTPEQLASNLRARSLPVDAAAALWTETAPEPAEAYWAHRKTLAWT